MVSDQNSGNAATSVLDPCGRNGSAYAVRETAYRRRHMRYFLHRVGGVLPHLLSGQDLIRESRAIERLCWRELGLVKQPIFDGDLPDFLMLDGASSPINLSIPTDPVALAGRLAALEPPPPAESCIGTNLDTLARLLNFTPFEFNWLLWSYCIRRAGSAILPVVPLRDTTHGCDMLAALCEMPVDAVRDAVASRRLHTWGFLDGISADGEVPSLLSGWLSATDQFADWIEQPFASDSDLLTALCQAQVSLMASR